MRPRDILHLDLDAFFCAVEIRRHPALTTVPFVVGGRPDRRGVVAACSYPARVYGVHSAMPMSQALQRCPELRILPHDFAAYREASRAVMALLHDTSPLVEPISIDEAFLDVTGLTGGGMEAARRLQQRINAELRLPVSIGVATSKLLAKIANNIGKAKAAHETPGQPPNAILGVSPGEEAAFLAPLPVRELWGVGPRMEEKLTAMGVTRIGQLAQLQAVTLSTLFGKPGTELHLRAQGIDPRPVVTDHETKSVSHETTFPRDRRDLESLHVALRTLSDGVGYRLRRAGLRGRTVTLKLRWSDFTTVTRQLTLKQAIDQDEEVYSAARALFDEAWPQGRPVRLIGVGVSGFDNPPQQMSLWDMGDPADPVPTLSDEQRRLQTAVDDIRKRYGERSISRGSTMKPRPKPRRPTIPRQRPNQAKPTDPDPPES